MEPMTHITDVRAVAVPVTDQDRAVEYYTQALGFETRLDAPIGPGQRWIEVAPSGATTSIALVLSSDTAPAGVDTGVRFTTKDADADNAALRSRGADVDDVLRWEGVPPMFVLRDPDGNSLYVVEA
jgi:catechol 2,3-dioxygenase-like lactoylglutathione lyase family enzyme